jgi:protein tyrosine phosphatase (PTP) superfamily phosphohydrolase (DUF442 family)
MEAKGLHNVYRITDKLISGSSPDGDEGFESLKALGVKTIISVDGARPDLDRARKYGLRYVHLPTGYDGISRPQVLQLAKAVRDLPGPIYLHCHHGKHRGPAAASAIHLCLDEKCSVEQAVAEMKLAGTDPHYIGLYETAKALVRPSKLELDQIAADFPEVAAVSALAQVMVQIDGRWDNLKLVRSAGGKVPADHPDIDPPHEALQLAEHATFALALVIALDTTRPCNCSVLVTKTKVTKSSGLGNPDFSRNVESTLVCLRHIHRDFDGLTIIWFHSGAKAGFADCLYSACVHCTMRILNVPPSSDGNGSKPHNSLSATANVSDSLLPAKCHGA